MNKLSVSDLLSLERYARERAAFRTRVLEHKRARQLAVGAHTTWLFEDRLTVHYQVQEMAAKDPEHPLKLLRLAYGL